MVSRLRRIALLRASWTLAAALAVTSCEEGTSPPVTCEPSESDACIGVPEGALCEDTFCTDGVTCAEIIEVGSTSELAGALGDASSGACIALGPGEYGAVELPAGVSLLGRGAAFVKVESVRLGAGRGATIRGLAVTGGIDAGSTTETTIDSVLVSGGQIGLKAGAGADVVVTRSEVRAAVEVGVLIEGASSVTVSQSVVAQTAGPGMWSVCDPSLADACGCAVQPTVVLEHVVIQQPTYAAVHFAGTKATMNDVTITDVLPSGTSIQKPGGGLSVTACSTLDYRDVSIEKAGSYGMLVDHAAAAPSSGMEEHGIIIIDTKPGLWIKGTDDTTPVVLDSIDIQACRGTGLGIDLDAKGIIIIDTKIKGTLLESVPVAVEPNQPPAVAQIGLGLAWRAGAAVQVNGIEVADNATNGILIDGPVGAQSSLANVVLGPGDDTEGVVQQQVMTPADAPATMGVALTQTAQKISDVPIGPEAPTP